MIPYFQEPAFSFGPVTVTLFSILVGAAVVVGIVVLRRRSRHEGLDPGTAERLVWWTLAGGFVGAHLIDRLAYFPADTMRDPWSLLRIWDGMSSFGGFLGAVAGLALAMRWARPGPAAGRYVDAIAYAFPFGWVVGRLGCFAAFDHPGRPTSLFLGQTYSDSVVRHNLGLEEALYTAGIAVLFAILGRRPRPAGVYAGLLALTYAPGRFLLDFLRIGDATYGGLTPGQWGSLALLPVGWGLLLRARKSGESSPAGG